MNRFTVAGILLTLVGLAGYGTGIASPYPGRAFSVTTVMIGITLLAVRRIDQPEGAG